ncbi:amino acid adenylation domain-containing protein [Bacillus atrophaeus]|uniref:amino acid adenylation domain-containing protein n=1 Tax=Bacillus atrophaeus TaxID=1452 RepID=UPI0022804CBD|nr:amino acid adenylation domain-containing protein [Bacillus atrophaeus]MCY9165986.1 amino acid adenylation domain-containing protein [Bacillus atrophaeus]
MSEISDRLSKLSEDRKTLFNSLLEKNKSNTNQISKYSRNENVYMSHAQQRLWFIDELDPGNPAYTCPVPLRLRGSLNKEALVDSLNAVVRRHEVLRTTYDMYDGVPIQIIHDDIPLELQHYDFSKLPSSEQQKAIDRVIEQDATTPFNLRTGPIMRAILICLNSEEHVLIVDIHHIANDHWSIGILFRELAAIYNKCLGVENQTLTELPIQYADYSLWQHERLESSVGINLLNFWKKKLENFQVINLPTDHLRPATISHRGAQKHFKLRKELVTALQELAKEERASLYMVMLAAFKVVLARYTGQTDISLGCSITGRDRSELQGLIGFFVNTIILRTQFDDDPSFRELLQLVRTNSLEAYANSEYPFDLLVQALNPHRSADRNPLASVMFMLDETPSEVAEFNGLDATWLDPSFITTKFDILLSARPTEEGVYGHIQYSTDLFEADTIERLIEHYLNVLEEVAKNSMVCLSKLPLLSAKERDTILVEWNDTALDLPYNTTLHETFRHRVEKQSDATAIISGNQTLCYGDLNRAAERLSSYLRTVCTKPEEVIAISIERSPEFVIAVLAILKSGCAYVPLDPSHHTDTHLINTMQQVGARILISRRKNEAESIHNESIQMVYVDDFTHNNFALNQIDGKSQLNNKQYDASSCESLAYVICSSGSTGKPKAIAIRHQGALNNLLDINQRFAVSKEDRILFLSSPSFDMSVYETMGMLIAGGTLVIPDSDSLREPTHWLDLMRKNEVTIWNSAPALLEVLVEELERANDIYLPNLRLVLLGGDWIPVSIPDRLRKYAPNVRVIALGGATEASIHSTIYSVDKTEDGWTSIPYGEPMANQHVYVLDRWMQPTPVGVPGELYLGGVGLAREYIGLPELTQKRFVDYNLRGNQPERLFRTGDLARWRKDGNLELIGRIDFQAKIHGLRVDLSDIESALCSYKDIKEAVVVVNTNDKRGSSLIAYYVPINDKDVVEINLREYLTQILPIYMIPSSFRGIDSLPKNRSGKVDRLALKKITPQINEATLQEPTDTLEASILNSWKQILGIDDIGIDDDFFEIGGDSFSAIRLSRTIEGGLPVVELFKQRTVRMIANYLRSSVSSQAELLYRLTPESDHNISLVCIPYGGGNVSVYQSLADSIPSHIALWSVALPGHDPGRRGESYMSWEDIAEKCCREIIEKIDGPIAIYGQCSGSTIAVYLTQLLEKHGREVHTLYVGAALPDIDPVGSRERSNSTSENELEMYLQSIGGFDGALDYGETKEIIAAVRHDMLEHARFFEKNYKEPSIKLRTPLHCVLGECDVITNKQENRAADWKAFATNVKSSRISRGNHYFVKHEAMQLARLLAKELSLENNNNSRGITKFWRFLTRKLFYKVN